MHGAGSSEECTFLYKVWTYVFWCKVQGLIYLRNSFFCGTHTWTRRKGHVVSLRVTWSWFGQSTNRLTASWGSESPFSSTLSIHKSSRGEKENMPSSFASWTPTPFYPSSPCFIALWKTSFISVRERLPIDNYALLNLYISLCPSMSLLQPVCLIILSNGWTSQRKKTDEIFPLHYQDVDVSDITFEDSKGWRQQ